MDQDKRQIFQCECGCHAVFVTNWDDEDMVCFSMWRYGTPRYSLKERLRAIWYILKRGHPYEDEVILDYPAAQELARFLLEQAQEPATR